jgi:DSF synthase
MGEPADAITGPRLVVPQPIAAAAQQIHGPFHGQAYREIETTLSPHERALWCMMKPSGRSSFTRELLADLSDMQVKICEAFARSRFERPFDFLVFGSRTPGVFNLGGDLELFKGRIERGDETGLRSYAHQCVEVLFANHIGYGNRIITIALIQGDALGGGFESALSCDYIVAEKQAKLGFPEILFNLFPGMGAYTFLSRRVGVARTEEMLRTGQIYSAEELHNLGIVDFVVEEGRGEAKVKELIAKTMPRHNAQSSIHEVRRRINPVTLAELKDIADIWVESAMRLEEHDLRRMSRITAAQDRARNRQSITTNPAT